MFVFNYLNLPIKYIKRVLFKEMQSLEQVSAKLALLDMFSLNNAL